MLYFPKIDPVIVAIGPLKIRWYGLMYLLGFIIGYFFLLKRSKKQIPLWKSEEIIDLIFYIALGIIFGGKIGYILFYQPFKIFDNPLYLLQFWVPGRSFHAGLLGAFIAVLIYAKKHNRLVLKITDFVIPAVPIGLGLGRIGNFINAELWGRVTNVPWGIVFPFAGQRPRHPSQLYEFFFEGLILFLILYFYSLKRRKRGAVSGLFLICYAVFRFFVEFFREPDDFLGFIFFDWMTMGQFLSIPMFLIGIWLFFRKVNIK